MPIQTLKGPWGGMDMREGEAAPNSYFLGINIDTSAGQLAARPPLGVITTGAPALARLHLVDRPGLPKRILALGQASTTPGANITFRVYDEHGIAIAAAQDLTADLGEAARDDLLCSFADAYVRPTDTLQPRPVVLVTTDVSTYVYDLTTDTGSLRRGVVSTDSLQISAANLYYVAAPMPGPITVTHATRLYYMGFRSGTQIPLASALPAASAGKGNNPPEAYVSADRGSLSVGPHVLMWSDESDPFGVASINFAMVDPCERITGGYSTGEVLLIFTDKGVWMKSGSTEADFAIRKLVHNTGCVAHQSIVTVGGVTYFAGPDGIYAFGGIGAPEAVKISAQLDPLWEGGEPIASQLPEAFRTYLGAAMGFPWTVRTDLANRTVGRHYGRPNQIWWSLPVVGTWAARAMGVTLVYDVQGNHWNLYLTYPSLRAGAAGMYSNTNYATAMVDAVQLDGRWICSSGMPEFRELGVGRWDGTEDATVTYSQGVPVYWCSRRFPDSGDDILMLSALRFKMLTRGLGLSGTNSPTLVGSGQVPANRPMWFVEGESAAFDFETDGAVPVTDYDQRQTRTGEIQCHPYSSSDSFLGSFVLDSSKLAATDWFTSLAPVGIRSRWFRIGFRDDCGVCYSALGGVAFGRATVARFSSIGLEMTNEGTARR